MLKLIAAAVLSLSAVAAWGQHAGHHHAVAPQPAAAITKIEDVPVQTQDGSEARFYSDLVKGRVTAINFIFTSCTTVCPLMGVRFAQLQTRLDELADDVTLVSVSIDPTNDTPERLAAWAKRLGAKPGWTLVTGAKPDMDKLLRSLGASAADPSAHTPLVLIVDSRNGKFSMQRLDGLTDPATLAKTLDQVVHAK
jgi:protein SCO1/2